MNKLTVSVFLTAICWTATAQQVTLASLLQEMTSREHLAKFPEPAFQTLQFSSYDRKAKRLGGENWFANRDHTHFIRRESTANGEEFVMFEAKAPGAIVRWWMTFGGFVGGAGDGTIRVYVDGAEEPVIEGTAFELMSGGQLVGPPLSMSVSELTPRDNRGHNLYLPLPYAKSCKITYQNEGITANEAGEVIDPQIALYYVINYREYGPEVEVESFDENSLNKYGLQLAEAQLQLAMPYLQTFSRPPGAKLKMRKLGPGESMKLEIQGEQCIDAIRLQLDAENIPQALRSTTISLQFDGQTTLEMPIGEFFGTGYQINPYETFYTKVYKDGMMVSTWPMPFRSSARIQIKNLGEQVVKIQDLNANLKEWEWNERSMYFGGSWKQFYDRQTGGSENPEDLVFNTLKGKGVYVGDLITLYNNASSWWGEGDEKIYVDGEDFPSHFGTGSEDYYGYAWGRPEAFSHPFIAQPDGSGNLEPGTTVNVRFRGLDKIPFQERLKMTMELWHWAQTTVHYAPATFFYLRPGGKSETSFQTREATRPVALRPEKVYQPEMEEGKIQGEEMEPVRVDAGTLGPQGGKNSIWDEGWHLWWRRAEEGDALHLQFTSDRAYSNRNIELQLTKAKDYGVVAISLNDGPELIFDGYNPKVIVEKVQIENATVKKGTNTFKIKVKGRNEKALEGHMFGLDYAQVK